MIAKFSLLAVLAGACFAAESQIEGPKLGYMYDRQASLLRPILGIPGSALFGEPLSSDLREAVVSPSQDYAVGVFGDDSAVGILNFAELTVFDVVLIVECPCRLITRRLFG